MKKIGMGLIGAGLWGETHARIFSSHPFSEFIAVCDVIEEKAQNIANKYGAKRHYTNISEMLEDPEIEAVGITTPDFAHCDPFIAACRSGKNILIEKPLAISNKDLKLMKKAYQDSGVKVMVDFHARWNPPYAITQKDIQEGKLGKLISMYYRLNDIIYVPTQMLSWAEKSSILWFLGSHTVDTLRFFTESEVTRVYSVSRSEVLIHMGINVPDIYQSILEFENGVIATIENSWIIPNNNPQINDIKLNILGSKGMVNMDLTGNQSIERYLENRNDHPDILVMPTIHEKPMGFAHESIRDFIERLKNNREFIVDFSDGYKVSKVILAIMESAKKRIPIEVDYT